jgi:MFS family permease
VSPDAPLIRTLRLYGWFAPLRSALFWTPVFFLYLSERFPIQVILQLHALYYLAVVILEVPSGYLSDRVGRVLTLRLSAVGGALGYGLFLLGGSNLALFALAQFFLAVHFSFLSGTDTSLHFDTLNSLDRASQYGDREARIQRNSFLVGSVAAATGGAVAVVDLGLAYLLALGAALVMLGLTLAMREPPRHQDGFASAFGAQLRACAGLLRRPFLAWIFAYWVLQTTLEHVPYEFAQPYIAAVLGESVTEVRRTPLATGAIAALIYLVGALAATRSMVLWRRFGTGRVLVGLTALQTTLIGARALVIHPLVLPLITLRNCQPAIGHVVANAAIIPQVPQAQRATYLSLHSLSGRIGYSAVLFTLSSTLAADAPNDPDTVTAMLRGCFLLAVVGLVILAAFSRSAREEPQR